MRLRPRESTWLDTLLAVDKGCLVRTRPVCMRRDEYSKDTHKKKQHTAAHSKLHTLQLNEAQNLRSTTADEKILMLEAAKRTSDPKLNTQIQPGAHTDKYTRDASVDQEQVCTYLKSETGHDPTSSLSPSID